MKYINLGTTVITDDSNVVATFRDSYKHLIPVFCVAERMKDILSELNILLQHSYDSEEAIELRGGKDIEKKKAKEYHKKLTDIKTSVAQILAESKAHGK